MSGDLVSIRLICVGATPSLSEFWRQGTALASVPVEFSTIAGAAAIAALNAGGVDICLIDWSLPEAERMWVLAAARAAAPPPFIVAVTPHADTRIDGVDRVLPRPRNAEEARRMIDVCLRVKIPTPVLIVDDFITMRSIVRKILTASRFVLDIHEASEGAAALDQLRKGRFAVVFLDYNMPDIGGLEILAEIKRMNPDVAVVMMTATLDTAVAERARAAGALSFLKKPFYPADIDALLERHFGLQASIG